MAAEEEFTTYPWDARSPSVTVLVTHPDALRKHGFPPSGPLAPSPPPSSLANALELCVCCSSIPSAGIIIRKTWLGLHDGAAALRMKRVEGGGGG